MTINIFNPYDERANKVVNRNDHRIGVMIKESKKEASKQGSLGSGCRQAENEIGHKTGKGESCRADWQTPETFVRKTEIGAGAEVEAETGGWQITD